MTSRPPSLTVWADLLTISRIVIALALIPAIWSQALSPAAVMVSLAWVSDLLDGRIARLARHEGRLGKWDMHADTMVGGAIIIGLTGSGDIAIWASLALIVVLGSLFIAGNLAAAMLLQLAGYLPLLAILWIRRPEGWWLPPATALVIGVVDWRRLIYVNISDFIRGVAGRFEGHR